MKRINAALLALGTIFLSCLVWRIGWRELLLQLTVLGWGILLMVAIEGLANVAHTLGWRHCIHDPDHTLRFWRLFRMNMAGWAINYLTPTASLGGEVTRGALLASTRKGADAAGSVLLDKLMTGVAHLALALLGAAFLFSRVNLPARVWAAMTATTLVLIACMTLFILLQERGKLGALCRWLAEHKLGGRFVLNAAQNISTVDSALKRFYRDHPGQVFLSFTWHFVGHSTAILQAWLFLYLLHQPAAFTTVAAAGCLSLWFDLLTFAVPMNLGTLEASRIVVLKSLGCQALLGMTFGVAVRIAQLFWACFGLAGHAFLTVRQGNSRPTFENAAPANAPAFATTKLTSGKICYLEDKV